MDWTLFQDVNRFAQHTGWLHGVARTYASLGVGLFAAALAAAALVTVRRDVRAFTRTVWAAIAALVVLALNQPVASLVGRARPYTTHPHVLTLVTRGTDPSFMSDHSVVAGAVAAGLYFAVRSIGIATIVAAIIMAFMRVYVGAHYPGDVVAGLAFGALVAAAGIPVADRYLVPITERVLSSRVGRSLARTN